LLGTLNKILNLVLLFLLKRYQDKIIFSFPPSAGLWFRRTWYDIHLAIPDKSQFISVDFTDGCPSCVGPLKEVGKNSKRVAVDILSLIAR